MKVVKYILRSIIWSAAVSVVLRILFGFYSVFGPLTLIAAAALGIGSATALFAPGKFMPSALLHIILVTASYVLSDYTGVFRMLPIKSAELFGRIAGNTDGRVNILWCIMFIMPVYFLLFLIFDGIISAIKDKKRRTYKEDELYYNEDDDEWSKYEDEDIPEEITPKNYVKTFRRK